MQWDIHMRCGRHICSGAYANSGKLCIAVLLVAVLIAVSSYEVYILTTLSHICTWRKLHIWYLRSIFVSGTYLVIICGVHVFFFYFFWTWMYSNEAYNNNVKCMCICVPGHIADCIGFNWGIYTDIVVSCTLMYLNMWLICGILGVYYFLGLAWQ